MGGRSRLPSGLTPALRWTGPIVVLTLILLWPAFYNRYPTVYIDTADSIRSAVHMQPGLRSLAYALYLRLASLHRTGWAVAASQAVLIAGFLLAALRTVLAGAPRWGVTLIATAAALTSALPVYASILQPDFFILIGAWGCFLLCWARGRLLRTLGWLGISVSGAMHASLLPVLLILCAGVGLVTSRWRAGLQAAAAVVAGALGLCVLNAHFDAGFTYNQGAPTFLFARMVGDDLIRPTLREVCPKVGGPLCAQIDRLGGMTCDDYLWHDISPRRFLRGPLPVERYERQVVVQCLRRFPFRNLQVALRDAWAGLLLLGTPHTPDRGGGLVVLQYLPSLWPRDEARASKARQVTERWPGARPQEVVFWVWLGLGLLALARLRPHRSELAARLWVLSSLAVAANTFCCSFFSNSFTERYYSRANGLLSLCTATTLALLFRPSWRNVASMGPSDSSDGTNEGVEKREAPESP